MQWTTHALADQVAVNSAAWAARRYKYFSRDIESPPLTRYLEDIEVELPPIGGTGFFEVPLRSPVGELDAGFRVARWMGAACPTIIYHHGNAERPFDLSFRRVLLTAREEIGANLLAIRAPFHRDFRQYLRKLTELGNFAAMMAASVRVGEALVQWLRRQGCREIVFTGISMGGFATNLHRTYFDSADTYVPLFAGTRFAEVFLYSAYRQLTGELALAHPQKIKETLGFEQDFRRVKSRNVFPLLALYDQIVRYEVQGPSYGDHPLATIPRGHTTGALNYTQLRRHILQAAAAGRVRN